MKIQYILILVLITFPLCLHSQKLETIKPIDLEYLQPISTSTLRMSNKGLQARVRSEMKDMPVLIDIARCESKFRQWEDNGTVLRGKINKKDVGLFQINEKYHLKASKRLGMDIHTVEGNIAYAKYLYKKEGSTPWNWSGHCWNK